MERQHQRHFYLNSCCHCNNSPKLLHALSPRCQGWRHPAHCFRSSDIAHISTHCGKDVKENLLICDKPAEQTGTPSA